jgi:histidyl-tRNA synthetase
MDYYNLTVFEFVTTKLGSQGTICAGGRYDYLVGQIGGKEAPAVGWAMGVERVLELLKEQGVSSKPLELDAYAIVQDAAAMPTVQACLQVLRACGISVQMQASAAEGMPGMKSQFKRADSSGARFALIFGLDEVAAGVVTVKSLRDGQGQQTQHSIGDVNSWALSLKHIG